MTENKKVEPFRVSTSIEEMRKRKLMLGLPAYGGLNYVSFTKGIADLSGMCAQAGITLGMNFLSNESLIPRARNYVVDGFLRSDFTHFMFIDSDIGFQASDVLGMMSMMSDDSPYDVICAPYQKKVISYEKLKYAVDKGFADENPNELSKFVGDFVFNPLGKEGFLINQPVEVSEAGTGFMMIRRSAFEMFEKAYPSQKYRPDHIRTKEFDGSRMITAFFDCPIDRGFWQEDSLKLIQDLANAKSESFDALQKRAQEMAIKSNEASHRYLSEDYAFCRMLRDVGGRIWMLPWVQLDHTGTMTFGGTLMDMARLGVSPTADPEMLKKAKK